ncbi:YadA-like family protein [Psychrobacter sp. AOP3-A1-26]|uniref:YadA-like family protein n=1 Tax=Psychrobacter sp. AOP3-A1-26 TaxID=3457700 RepID=UPI004035605D
MNRNYKVIWNASLNCFMAVAEYAKARGKSSKSSVSSNATINTTSNLSSTSIFRITTLGLGLVAFGFSLQATAVPCDGSAEVECGTNATASALHGIAIGKNATVLGSQGIAIGGGSSGQNTTAAGEQSIAIGANVVSSGASSIGIGGDDLDAASKTNFDGTISTGPLNSGDVNTTFNEYAGRDLLELSDRYGGHTEASGAASIAMGAKARSAGNLATAIGIHSSASGIASSAFGVASSATEKGALALGAGAQALVQDGVALGSRSAANVAGGIVGFAPTNASTAERNAITATNSTTLGAVSVGSAKDGTRQIVNLAAGTNDSDAVNVAQLKGVSNAIVTNKTHFYGVNSTDSTRGNYNNDGATGVDAMAAGIDAKAAGDRSVAMGTGASAMSSESTALGAASQAFAASATAVGFGARADQYGATAMGVNSRAQGQYSTAVGQTAQATGDNSIALAKGAKATKKSATAVGVNAEALGERSVALGEGAQATTLTGTAIGSRTRATGIQSTAVGVGSKATKQWATAMGFVSEANGVSSVALGDRSVVDGKESIAIGKSNTVSGKNSIAVGTGHTIGGDNSGAFGDPNIVNGNNSYAVGNNNTIDADNSFVLGNNVTINASDKHSIAVGEGAIINGEDSIAIGRNASAAAGTRNGLAIGVRSKSGNHAVSLGDDATSGNYAVALGSKAKTQIGGTAIGQASSAVSNATALGRGAIAGQSGNVALGNQSITAAQHTGAFAINNLPVAGLTSGARTVSVGAIGAERQIQNVAPGVVDANSTDAINGSQLFGTNSVLKDLGDTVDDGLNFDGDTGTTVNRKLGQKLTVKGGATTPLSDNNIGVVASSPDTLTVKLAKNIDLGKTGSVKMGTSAPFGLGPVTNVNRLGMTTGNALTNTDVNGLGVFVKGPLDIVPSVALTSNGLNIIGGPSVTKSGIDAGGKVISNVKDGVAPKDGVNVSQLVTSAAGSRTEVTKGTNVASVDKTTGGSGQDVYTVNADGASVSAASSGAVSVTPSTKNPITNMTDYEVDLSQASKDSLVKADNSVQYDDSTQTSVTLGGAGAVAPVALTNVAAGDLSATSTDAVNGSQLFETNTKVNKGFGIKAADGNTVQKNLGEAVEVVGSNSNITTQVNGGKVEVALNNNLDLGANGSVKMGTSAPFGLGPVTTVNRLGMTTGNIAGSTSVTGLGVVVNGPFGIPSTTLTTNGLNIIGGPSVTKTGIDAGNKKITRVDAGTAGTDAVNVDQLGAAISSNKTKYYSVNSTGGTNDLNEGATGQNAMAMGRNSVATGSQAISIGSSAGGQKTTASGEQSIAMGANTVSKGASSIAIGGDDLDAASKANLTGASSTAVNGGSVNTTFKAYTGRDLVETPPYQVNTASDGTASIAMGAKALSKGALSTAIGIQSSSAGVASSAFGVGSSASEEGSVALGAGSVANVAGGVVGYVPTGISAADATAITNTQSGARYGAVSVGNGDKGGNRQIVNLAAGTNDSDAVNVAQLKGGVSSVVDLGLNFDGDTGTTVNRKLGQKLTVKGGATTPLSDNNIGVVASSPDTLTVKLAKDLTGLDSVTTGGTVMNNSGLRVGNSLVNQNGFTFLSTGSPNNTVRLTKAGLHNGNKQITGVGSAGDLTDINNVNNAVNVSDLNDFSSNLGKVDVAAGTNVNNVTPMTVGNLTTYTVNADGAKVSVGSALTVSDTKDTTTNLTDYKVDLSADTKSSLGNADSALQSVVTQIDGTAVKTINKANNTANFVTGDNMVLSDDLSGGIKIATAQDLVLNSVKTGNTTVNNNGMTIAAPTLARTVVLNSNGLNNGGNKITNVKAGEADTDVVNVGQLNLANTTINKGLDFGGDSGTDVNRKLGEKLIVKGGDTINADPTTKNISVTANGADTLTVRLAKDINLGNTGSVTTGNTQVNNAGITLYNGSNDQVVLTNNGLNNGNNKITNVAVGTLNATSKDAVNGSQLFETNEKVAKGIKFDLNGNTKTYALGEAIQVATDANITTTAFGNGAKFGLADTIKVGGTSTNAVSINGTAGTIKGLSNTTFDADAVYDGGQAATQEQLSGLQSGINTTFNKGISFAGDSGTDVNRKLGDRVIVKGGVSDPTKLTDSNIGVIADGTDTLSVKLAKDLTGLNSASFGNNVMISSTGLRAGDTLVNQNGVTFTSEESPSKTVLLSSNGLNNGGNKITNVAKGEAKTDAVNVQQLNEVKKSAADANKGWDLSAQGDTATTTTVKPSAKVDLNNTDGNITVSKTADSNDVSFNLNKDIAIESVKTGVVTMNGDGLTIAGGPKFTKTSIDAGGNKVTNVANGIVAFESKDAVNGGQLQEVITGIQSDAAVLALEMGAGLNFNADSGPVINKKAGSNPLSLKGGNNITTTSEGSSIKFDLNGNINVDSVTTGNTTVSTNGISIKNGPSMTASGIYAGNLETAPSMTSAGINAAGTKITNVADGMAPRDAVNLAQLDAVGKRLGDNMNQLGYKIGEVEDDANAGISAAMAMSSLPQAYIAGKSLIGGGIGTYNGESAVAIGFSKLFDDGRWIMKLNGTADTQGNVGASVGAGFHFD